MKRPLEKAGYTVRPLTPDDGDDLQALCERCADYFELISGLPPGPSEAQSLFFGLPEGKGYEDKFVIGVFDTQGHLVGVLDVIRDYPEAGIWHIGLLLLEPVQRQRGLGTAVYRAFEQWAGASGAQRIRLGVAEQNKAAFRFWHRLGFDMVEKRPPKPWGNKAVVIIVMQKWATPSPS